MALKKILTSSEALLSNVAGLSIAIMAVSITVDVVARYGFSTPFIGIYTLTQNYLLVLVAYFALAYTERDGLHVRITMLTKWLPDKLRRAIYCIANLLTAMYFALLFWKGGEMAWHAWRGHEVSSGIIAWPLYVGYALVPIGAALIIVRLIYDCLPHVSSGCVTKSND